MRFLIIVGLDDKVSIAQFDRIGGSGQVLDPARDANFPKRTDQADGRSHVSRT